MKVLRVLPIVVSLSICISQAFAQNHNKAITVSSNESAKTLITDPCFVPTDHVGPGALSFMVGKWQGTVNGESWEEVWSENKDKTLLMCLKSIQNKNGVVDFEVCILRAGRHGGTPYFKKLSPMLIEESRDPWIGGIGQDNANSAFIELNLKDENGAVKDSQVLSYTKKSEKLTILKVKKNGSEKIIELHKASL